MLHLHCWRCLPNSILSREPVPRKDTSPYGIKHCMVIVTYMEACPHVAMDLPPLEKHACCREEAAHMNDTALNTVCAKQPHPPPPTTKKKTRMHTHTHRVDGATFWELHRRLPELLAKHRVRMLSTILLDYFYCYVAAHSAVAAFVGRCFASFVLVPASFCSVQTALFPCRLYVTVAAIQSCVGTLIGKQSVMSKALHIDGPL